MKQRQDFVATMRTLDPEKLVFLDESNVKTNMTRSYGWAARGERPVFCASKYGKNLTIIGAIALDGPRAWQLLPTTVNGPRFLEYLDGHLGPTLEDGDIVVMDGPRVHRVAGVTETLAKWGARVLYLPPYSPELNPIEMCWSWLKAWVRTRCPRVAERLIAAVAEAWGRVTADLCRGWVRHSGYAVST